VKRHRLRRRYGHTTEPFSGWRFRVVKALANRFVADGMHSPTAHHVAAGIVDKAKGLRAMHRKGVAAVIAADRIRSSQGPL
jgi:hypothetical protein